MANNNNRVASPRTAASAYAKVAPAAEAAPAPTAPRHSTGGFWLGLLLVVLALALMLGKTLMDYVNTPDTAAIKSRNTQAFARTQAHLETWRTEEAAFAENLPVYPHNPAIGSLTGPVVVEFIDLGCVPCRAEIQRLSTLRQEYAGQARFITKLLPDKDRPLATEAAVFAQIAHDHGKFWQFRDAVSSTTQDGVPYYLTVLEGLGIPLRDVRREISQKQEDYLKGLRQDTAIALELNLSTPTNIFIGGHRLGQPGLAKSDAESILMRAIAGEPLVGLE